ncbi:GGDEF domain-containing protein [Candidatus Woesearchaeota archaeon]|nr:GGDEF domain-containing protein [Candidatus Woesearchaeota archaeon]
MENLEDTVKLYDEIAASLSPDSMEYQKLTELRQDYIALKKDNEKKEKKIAILGPKAIEDGLTKAYNHSYFKEQLEKEVKKSDEDNVPVSLIAFDIDNFKHINDTYGHPIGDDILVRITELGKEYFTGEDLFCRYGGDEFTVIMPDTIIEDAAKAAEEYRKLVEKQKFDYKGHELKVTLSLGVVQHTDKYKSSEGLFTAADTLLYEAKKQGRNMVASQKFE